MNLQENDSYIDLILKWLSRNNHNDTDADFSRPHIKHTLKDVYPLFVFLHAIVALFGSFGNLTMLTVIIRKSLYHDPAFFLLGNLGILDILKAAVVLPVSLANLLLGNWIFGSFLCYFLPMMQDFPFNGTMLTYVMISVVRYRAIVYPMRSRLPVGLCVIALWVVSICLVLPYAVYMKYFDLGKLLGHQFDGAGICYVHVERHIEEYIRAMFVCLYVLPLAVVAFLYIRVSAEFKSRDTEGVVLRIGNSREENGRSFSDASYPSRMTCSTSDENRVDPEGASSESTHMRPNNEGHRYETDDEIDVGKEKRAQGYLVSMVMLYATCWCPLKILILVTHFVSESSDNSGHFDITYLTFTFLAFLSTCINPVLFASWRMSDRTRDRLKGYFRFSNRRRGSSHSNGARASEIYAPTPSPCRHKEVDDSTNKIFL